MASGEKQRHPMHQRSEAEAEAKVDKRELRRRKRSDFVAAIEVGSSQREPKLTLFNVA